MKYKGVNIKKDPLYTEHLPEIIRLYKDEKTPLVKIAKRYKTWGYKIKTVLLAGGIEIRSIAETYRLKRTVTTDTERRCSKCHKWKPLDSFRMNRDRGKGNRDYICGECWKPIQRIQNWKRKYNITSEQYKTMLAAQGGVCLICHRPQSGKKKYLHIDHNHTTGKVRGLLCHSCNTVIGLMREDTNIAKRMIAYLEKN